MFSENLDEMKVVLRSVTGMQKQSFTIFFLFLDYVDGWYGQPSTQFRSNGQRNSLNVEKDDSVLYQLRTEISTSLSTSTGQRGKYFAIIAQN